MEASWLMAPGSGSETSRQGEDGLVRDQKNPDVSVLEDAGLGGHNKISVVAWVEGVDMWSEGQSCATSGLREYKSYHTQGLCSDGIVSASLSPMTMYLSGWSMPKKMHVCIHLYPLREEGCGVHEEREPCFLTCWSPFWERDVGWSFLA